MRQPLLKLRYPLRFLQQRMARWWLTRLPLSDSLTLNQHNIYILPTRPGLMLGITLLVLLVASINYQLNLGYLLTFLLAGCALVAIHVSHGNLRTMTMTLVAPEAVFAGSSGLFVIQLVNTCQRTRYAVGLAVLDSGQWIHTDIPAQSSASVQLAWQPHQRGLHRVPALSAQTFFPLGTFRVWTLWRPAAQVLVYPQPEPNAPTLPGDGLDEGQSHVSSRPHPGEPDGLRPYRRGDSLKSIVWKKAAKTGELVSRDSAALLQHELLLERTHTGLNHPEQQLSRLCAWVLQADQAGLRYGLRLGAGQDVTPGSGPVHLQHCLRALALAA